MKRIQGIKNVNAIPDNSELPVAHDGLTVVYGENAAGKSGYARILKRACFARDDKEGILGNVFRTSLSGPAEATFKVAIDGTDACLKWVDGQQKPEVLGSISVFDSKCARVILDEKNAFSYLPYGADVFQKLAGIVQAFKNKMEQEKPKPIKPEISDLPEDTKAGAVFKSLNAKTKEEDLVQWFQWTEFNEGDLNQLNVNYTKAVAGDTTKEIGGLENLKNRLNSCKEKLSEYAGVFSSKGVKNVNQLVESRNTYQRAFEIASQKPDGPLTGIGTDEWEVLYWAARDYSMKHAYPGEVFPATGGDKKCALCMQPLSDAAGKRLNAFHNYMENSAKKRWMIRRQNLVRRSGS